MSELLDKLETELPKLTLNKLTPFFERTTATKKQDGSIVTEADITMQLAVRDMLKDLTPDIPLLGEEMTANEQQQILDSGSSFWCLDPLDGTNNFHHGMPLYAVSLALMQPDGAQIGLIFDPVRNESFSAEQGGGLRINGQNFRPHLQVHNMKECLASVDFKRLTPEARQKFMRNMPFKSQRNIGTCALEWAWLAAGRIQLLLHGGEKLWDYAAGTLLVSEAGGNSCSFDKKPVYNQTLEPRPVVAAANASLQQQWMGFLEI